MWVGGVGDDLVNETQKHGNCKSVGSSVQDVLYSLMMPASRVSRNAMNAATGCGLAFYVLAAPLQQHSTHRKHVGRRHGGEYGQ